MGHPSNAMDVMGLHGDFPWCPIKCHGHHGTSWGFPLAPREIIKFHGYPMENHGTPIKCHGRHGASWGFPLVSHQMPWTPWDFMGISIGTKGNHKISWVSHGKPWDTHQMPWTSWDFMGISIGTQGDQKISWVSHGKPWCASASHGNPQYAMGIIWDAMGITIVAMGNPINPWGIKWKT
jgi:hypothetical protein